MLLASAPTGPRRGAHTTSPASSLTGSDQRQCRPQEARRLRRYITRRVGLGMQWMLVLLVSGSHGSASHRSGRAKQPPRDPVMARTCHAPPLRVGEAAHLRGCEACSKGASLPLAVCAKSGARPELHETTLALVRAAVTGGGSREERAASFRDGLLQLRLNRFFPGAVRLHMLRQGDEAVGRDAGQSGHLRHLLRARKYFWEQHGDAVAVHPYVGDPAVRFSIQWRVGPDEAEERHGQQVLFTPVAFQPVHPDMHGPLWIMRIPNATDEVWNPNLVRAKSPHSDPHIPDPFLAVDATFERFMAHLHNIVHLGWEEEAGDHLLLEHMQHGVFGVKRVRSQYEEEMDSRSFSHLLYRVVEEGKAGVDDGIAVLQAMAEAGLTPSYSDLVSLMTVAVGVARNGSQEALPEVDKVLDLMALLGMPSTSSIYLSAFHALAWSARAGKAGLDEAEALLCRMLDPEAQQPSSTATKTAAVGGQYDVLKDPDFYASILAVTAGAALSDASHEQRMNVMYEEDEHGMVEASWAGQGDAQGDVSWQGDAPLTWQRHADYIMQRMLQAQVTPNSLVYHARLQVAVGSAKRGELDMEDLECLLESLLHNGESLTHAHAESLLAAAVLGMEGGRLCMRQLDLLVEYIGHAALELDALCWSLWLRGVAHAVRERQARIQDMFHVIDLARKGGMRFSTAVLRFLALAVADHVRASLHEKSALDEVLELQEEVNKFWDKLLYLGGTPPKSFFDARLLLHAHAAEAGEVRQVVCGYTGECVAEEMMVAGHAPDSHTLVLMLRILAASCARGETGILDVARVIERAIAAAVSADEALLLQTMAAAEAAARHGGVSLSDALHLLSRAAVMGSTLDANRPRVLRLLLCVAGEAAQHGLATVDESLLLVERLLQALREGGEAACLEQRERDALVAILDGAARAGTATASEAEKVMRHLDVAGQRPSMRVLSVLLDVVLAEAARGQATIRDAAHVVNRIKGCGFACTHAEMRKLVAIVHASVRHGLADFTDALDTMRDLVACCSATAEDYLQILDCAQWAAYHKARHKAAADSRDPHAQALHGPEQATKSGGRSQDWPQQTWLRSQPAPVSCLLSPVSCLVSPVSCLLSPAPLLSHLVVVLAA